MVKRLLVATFVAIGPLVPFAQNLITGHITDVRTGEPLIGASVIVKSEKGKGVVTDVDGNFKLETKVEAPLTLKVEYVGYRALDVDVYDFDEPVEIALIDNSNRLDEVVVVGYGVQKRKQLTGAVTTVKNDELLNTSTSFDNILGGAVAGLGFLKQIAGKPVGFPLDFFPVYAACTRGRVVLRKIAVVQTLVADVPGELEVYGHHSVLPGNVSLRHGRVVVPVPFSHYAVVEGVVQQLQAQIRELLKLCVVFWKEPHVEVCGLD